MTTIIPDFVKIFSSTILAFFSNSSDAKYLDNKWKFKKKGKLTEVSFDVDFELKNKFLNILMAKSFKYGLDKIADAIQKRAEELFLNRYNFFLS